MTATDPADSRPLASTGCGQVRGLWRTAADGSRSAAFLGIPYAEPPVGPLRFAAPVPHQPWQGIREADRQGATPKRDAGQETTLIPEPAVPGESTLNVNVFTPGPGTTTDPLPVLVWIHGGAYTAGSPASPWYDGRAFNRDGVVTVNLSYRLGFEGFGHVLGAPGNRGVRDWLLALEWVRDNIAAFGGDPAKVTLAGQSAGGGAVLTLLGMPCAQGLFQRALCLSGALGDVTLSRAEALAERLAGAAGVSSDLAGFDSITPEELQQLQKEESQHGWTADPVAEVASLVGDGLPLGPAIDGELICRPTIESLRAGVGAAVPLVLGTADDEFTIAVTPMRSKLRLIPAGLALWRLGLRPGRWRRYARANADVRRSGTAAVVGRYVSDSIFRAPALHIGYARDQASPATGTDSQTWLYRFSWRSGVHGLAVHCLDVPFWFDCLDAEGVAALAGEPQPQSLADQLHGAAVRHVNGNDPGWPRWDREEQSTKIFDVPGSVQPHGYDSVRPLLGE